MLLLSEGSGSGAAERTRCARLPASLRSPLLLLGCSRGSSFWPSSLRAKKMCGRRQRRELTAWQAGARTSLDPGGRLVVRWRRLSCLRRQLAQELDWEPVGRAELRVYNGTLVALNLPLVLSCAAQGAKGIGVSARRLLHFGSARLRGFCEDDSSTSICLSADSRALSCVTAVGASSSLLSAAAAGAARLRGGIFRVRVGRRRSR